VLEGIESEKAIHKQEETHFKPNTAKTAIAKRWKKEKDKLIRSSSRELSYPTNVRLQASKYKTFTD
jgi:hypothetical protein